jgi:hypothetical protein
MPCFQAGAGAAAGAWACAARTPMDKETAKLICLKRRIEMYFTQISNLLFEALLYSSQCISD